jgi:L-arabinokinase
MPAIAFYISGHGFGHASRSIELINALADCRVIVRSQVAPWLFQRRARPGVELIPVETDTGIVQIDSLRLDAEATIASARAFMTTFDARVATEVDFLRAQDVTMVIADLPPLGIAAAQAAGLPAIAYGNFTWDWIYANYDGGADLARQIGGIYSHTTIALRLPMWGGFETMPKVHDLPFVARQSYRDPEDTRRALGLPLNAPIVLVSFGGYGLQDARQPIAPDYQVLWPGDVDEAAMYDGGYRYEDLVRAADVVVTKPGYGIISECIANDTALLYTSRGDFREYTVLVEAMPSYLRCAYIEPDQLRSGNWQPHLDRLLAQPAPAVKPATNGAEIAAKAILSVQS